MMKTNLMHFQVFKICYLISKLKNIPYLKKGKGYFLTSYFCEKKINIFKYISYVKQNINFLYKKGNLLWEEEKKLLMKM